MSIQTELSRIINAKAAIKAAIEGKGVTVPDATLLDGMSALIESIEAGNPNIIMLSITPATAGIIDIDLTEYGYDFSSIPKARFLFEDSGISYGDKSHTCRRTLQILDVSSDMNNFTRETSYCHICLYENNASNSFQKSAASVANMWDDLSNAYGNSTYSAMGGYISSPTARLRFYAFDPTTDYKYGCIIGRQYRLGVIL